MTKRDFSKLLKVDMNSLIREHFHFGTSMHGVLSSTTKDRTVMFSINSNELRLIYLCNSYYFNTFVGQKIALNWEIRKYGNTKAHFICPECQKKTLALYYGGISFVCRKCTRDLHAIGLTDKKRDDKICSYMENGTIKTNVWI